MVKKFKHSRIIRKYSFLAVFSREVNGPLIKGIPSKEIKNFKIKVAILFPNFERNQDFTDFVQGDKVMYVSKNEIEIPKKNDFLIKNNKKYVVKEISDNEEISDYVIFKIRRVVDDR